MILEALVVTRNAEGTPHLAPMGPSVPDDRPARDWLNLTRFQLRPFNTSQTYQNLRRHPEGVLHVSDDVLLLAQAAVGRVHPMPALRPAVMVQGWILEDACRWYEFRIVSIDDRSERVTLDAEVQTAGRGLDFLGFNRARHAILELAILATRVHLLPREQIEADLARYTTWVEKTGGPREKEVLAFLRDYLNETWASGVGP
jgi:hypothetical protein